MKYNEIIETCQKSMIQLDIEFLESEILTIKNDIKIVKTILNDNVRDASALCKEIETMEERKLKNFLNKASNKCEKKKQIRIKKLFLSREIK
jgi:peptidyl-tRNA hydrolase